MGTLTTPPLPQERVTLGKQKRAEVKRNSLAQWEPKARQTAPIATLHRANAGRVPTLVKLKYERMAASPFVFFRGAVPIMAADLASMADTGLLTQLCGDAHVQNLGAYTGPDGRLIFDINDFDETIRGPFEWDVKRMATSIVLAGSSAQIKEARSLDAVALFLSSYCTLMHELAELPVLETARFQVHRLNSVAPISKILAKAERSTPLHSLELLTQAAGATRQFKSNPPLLRRVTGEEATMVLSSLVPYAESLLAERRHFFHQFRALDVAFKVVGTGSVGLRDYCVYLEGNGAGDPLFLQIKEEAASAYAAYLPGATRPAHQGQRVAEGQRAMQLQSDPLLGWTTIDGRDYLVRQLNDHKAAIDATELKAAGLAQYATVCGEMLARGHARAGDARRILGYIGSGGRFSSSMTAFACAYAEQTVSDWKALKQELQQAANQP